MSQETANQHAINQQHLAEMQAQKASMDSDLAHDQMVKAESAAKAAQLEQQKANKEAKDAILA